MMLPKDSNGYELFVSSVGTSACVKPKTILKGTARTHCLLSKCAIPCDGDVPFAIACCGLVCKGATKYATPKITVAMLKMDQLSAKEVLVRSREMASLADSTGGAPDTEEMDR